MAKTSKRKLEGMKLITAMIQDQMINPSPDIVKELRRVREFATKIVRPAVQLSSNRRWLNKILKWLYKHKFIEPLPEVKTFSEDAMGIAYRIGVGKAHAIAEFEYLERLYQEKFGSKYTPDKKLTLAERSMQRTVNPLQVGSTPAGETK